MDGYAWIHFLVLALLAPVLLLCGTAAQIVRLPLITGYVLGGIIVGPYCLGILNADALQALAVVSPYIALLTGPRFLLAINVILCITWGIVSCRLIMPALRSLPSQLGQSCRLATSAE
jgi:hypothetical protein